MKFLLDVCVSSRSLAAHLVAEGHDVLSAFSVGPQSTDDQLLTLALREGRILVTADKDFGELVFVHDHPHGAIIRVVELTVNDQVRGVDELLEKHVHELAKPVIVTITRGRIRIRQRTE